MTALTLDLARAQLPCNKHTLDDDLERQPEMMDRVAQECSRAEVRMLRSKDLLARVEARILDDAKDGDSKLTKDQLEARVRRHADRTRAFDDYLESQEEYKEWSGLVVAWTQKGYSMKVLAELYANDYFARDSVSAVRRRPRDQDGARAALRQASAPAPPRRRAVFP